MPSMISFNCRVSRILSANPEGVKKHLSSLAHYLHCAMRKAEFCCVIADMITNTMNKGIIPISKLSISTYIMRPSTRNTARKQLLQALSGFLKPRQRFSINPSLARDLTSFKPSGKLAIDAPNSSYSF